MSTQGFSTLAKKVYYTCKGDLSPRTNTNAISRSVDSKQNPYEVCLYPILNVTGTFWFCTYKKVRTCIIIDIYRTPRCIVETASLVSANANRQTFSTNDPGYSSRLQSSHRPTLHTHTIPTPSSSSKKKNNSTCTSAFN